MRMNADFISQPDTDKAGNTNQVRLVCLLEKMVGVKILIRETKTHNGPPQVTTSHICTIKSRRSVQ